jgi:hypothetical protein
MATYFVIIHAIEELTNVSKLMIKQEGKELGIERHFYYTEEQQQFHVTELTGIN